MTYLFGGILWFSFMSEFKDKFLTKETSLPTDAVTIITYEHYSIHKTKEYFPWIEHIHYKLQLLVKWILLLLPIEECGSNGSYWTPCRGQLGQPKDERTRLYVNVIELWIILLTPHYSQDINLNAITCSRLTVIAFHKSSLRPCGVYRHPENIDFSERHGTLKTCNREVARSISIELNVIPTQLIVFSVTLSRNNEGTDPETKHYRLSFKFLSVNLHDGFFPHKSHNLCGRNADINYLQHISYVLTLKYFALCPLTVFMCFLRFSD